MANSRRPFVMATRLNAAEHLLVATAAKAQGVRVSEFVRRHVVPSAAEELSKAALEIAGSAVEPRRHCDSEGAS